MNKFITICLVIILICLIFLCIRTFSPVKIRKERRGFSFSTDGKLNFRR